MVKDHRNIRHGDRLPCEGYCDQPYVVQTNDGNWLCVMTTGPGPEGDCRQHVAATVSSDQGRTWSQLIDIEPMGPPEASWAMPLKTPSGRVYVFYTYNKDNVQKLPGWASPGRHRVDTLGHLAYKYSDDHGRTWSRQRYYVPMRKMTIDYENGYGGEVMFFWGVGKPIIHGNIVYLGVAKVGDFNSVGFMAESEGVFLKSNNILEELDPGKIHWETLPDGDMGLRSPKGPIADENNVAALSDGSLYATYRTMEGRSGQAYSRDGGYTWEDRQYASYSPGGRWLKHPRAATFVRKCSHGRFILWFHNHGRRWYQDRNPAWIAGGVERDGYIHWSQPEICLYDDNPETRISYPDFIEEDGHYFVTETQKTIARCHRMDGSLLEGMWSQMEDTACTPRRPEPHLTVSGCQPGTKITAGTIPRLEEGRGFALELWLNMRGLGMEGMLCSTLDESNKGIEVRTTIRGTLQLTLSNGEVSLCGETDTGLLRRGAWQHVVLNVDGGSRIMSFVVDGVLCDGGDIRDRGWYRIPKELVDVNGASRLTMGFFKGELGQVNIYDRYLRTYEAVGNYRTGRQST